VSDYGITYPEINSGGHMAEIIQLDVQKTLKQIPVDGVIDIVLVCLFDDDTIKSYTTVKTDDMAADLLYDALRVYEEKITKQDEAVERK